MKSSEDHKTGGRVWGGAMQAFSQAFEQVKANPKPALLFIIVYLVIISLELYGPGPGAKDSLKRVGSYETLAYLLFLLAFPIYGLAIADRKVISIERFLRFDLKKYLRVLGVTLLYGLIIVASVLLFVVPAVWTIAWFSMCVLAVVDKNMGPVAALKESQRLMQAHKGKVWGLIGLSVLLTIAVAILSAVPIVGPSIAPVLTALISVVSMGATAILYRWAQKAAA